jgi:transposase InsO family protein
VNTKRVQRLRAEQGLQVRIDKRKRRSLGHSENGCARRRPEHPNHVWSVDFVSDQTEDGRRLRILCVLDEFTRRCLGTLVERRIRAANVRGLLDELFRKHGSPEFIRADNGPEFIAYAIQDYLADHDVRTLYIAPGAPWENGYIESFNSRFRDELLDLEVFSNLLEAQVLVTAWTRSYNEQRPHSALGYATPHEYAAACVRQSSQEHHDVNPRLS